MKKTRWSAMLAVTAAVVLKVPLAHAQGS